MSEGDRKTADGLSLWLRARESAQDALAARAPDLDEAALAAYLDGRLDAAGRTRVEAALASSPETLDLLLASREALAAGPATAPEAVLARARALAAEPRALPARWASQISAWLFPGLAPVRALAFASVAAGFVMVSLAGFELGRAEVDYSAEIDLLVQQEVAGLIDRTAEDFL